MNQDKDNMKRAFIWNTASGMINAGQSAVILVFISHFLTRTDAGVFTIAYAFANLFMTMGKYGMRNFQVTDIQERFSFRLYRKSRTLTSALALVALIVYLTIKTIQGTYTIEKTSIIIIICMWKIIDSVEDVYYGMYQQQGRLDIAGKYYTFRLLISTVLFCGLVILRFSLLTASLITFIVSVVIAVIFIRSSMTRYRINGRNTDPGNLGELLKVCFPLFVSMSLNVYMCNAPKYMIDWYLDDTTQAMFSYLIMPAFLIMVLNQFIYQPIIRGLGELWQSGDRHQFRSRVIRQYFIIGGITAVIVAGGALLGIPMLSFLYNTDLGSYKGEFLLLLLGGGIYAIVSFSMIPLIAMRLQNIISYGMIAVTIISLVAGKFFVLTYGVMGASLLYLVLNTFLALYLIICFLFGVRSQASNGMKPDF